MTTVRFLGCDDRATHATPSGRCSGCESGTTALCRSVYDRKATLCELH